MTTNPIIFLAVWNGGYEPPEYVLCNDRAAAFAQANSWEAEGLQEGDRIDILRINTATGDLQVTNVA